MMDAVEFKIKLLEGELRRARETIAQQRQEITAARYLLLTTARALLTQSRGLYRSARIRVFGGPLAPRRDKRSEKPLSRSRLQQLQRRAEGLCKYCGEPCAPYARCARHRQQQSLHKAEKRRARAVDTGSPKL